MTPPEQTARRLLLSALRGRGRELRLLACWSTVQAVPAFLSGRLVAEAVDDGFLAGHAGRGFAWLGLLAFSAIIGAWATRGVFLRLAAIVEPFRDELAKLAVTGALRRSTEAGAAGDTAGVARLTQQVEIVRDAYASILLVSQSFVVLTIGALLGLLALMPEMLALVLPPLVIGVAIFLVALRHMAARQRDSILAEERMAAGTATLAADIRDVMACGAEDRAAPMVGEHIDAQARATRALARLTAVRLIAVAVGGLLPVILILGAGSWLVARGATAGMIFGALTYVLLGVQPALQAFVDGISGPGLWFMVTMRRIVQTSAEPPAGACREVPSSPAPRAGFALRASHGGRPSRPLSLVFLALMVSREWLTPRRRNVHLSGVTFAYGPCADPVIRELDLTLRDDEHLAVVGPSGVGKSTLANVIAGVLQPQAGEVRLGGVPLPRLDPASLTSQRVLIPQEAYVFAGSLYENLTYLHEDALRADIERAVDLLGMQALVERLGGYDAGLDPATLSAGERQLVTLVRAYVAPAWLVILDEASCHLDPRAEAIVEQAFARRPGTLIVIAHRISSALRAERILVLDGTQVLYGTHGELQQRSALYRDLVGHWQVGSVRAA